MYVYVCNPLHYISLFLDYIAEPMSLMNSPELQCVWCLRSRTPGALFTTLYSNAAKHKS